LLIDSDNLSLSSFPAISLFKTSLRQVP
jgi:hypothetical protein